MDNSRASAILSVVSTDISLEDAAKVKTGYFREARTNLIATFAIVAFVMSGWAIILFKLFWPFPFDGLAALGIGSAFGAFAVLWLAIVGFRDYPLLRSDLLDGRCEVLNVHARRAIVVNVNDKLDAIALDCGDYTLVLSGNWWETKRRSDIWRNSRERTRFPASEFVLRRLPRSGRVLAVEVSGRRLQVEENDQIDPLLKTEVPIFVESYYIQEEVDKLLVPRSTG